MLPNEGHRRIERAGSARFWHRWRMAELVPADDVTAADWVVAALTTFGDSVTSVVPSGYDSYVRLFHPAVRGEKAVSWREMAAASSASAHPAMQLAAFTGSDEPYKEWPPMFDTAPDVGELPRDLRSPLIAAL